MTLLKWLTGIVLICGAAIITFLAYPPTSPFSPLINIAPKPSEDTTSKENYMVLGFLPYWTAKKVTAAALENSTHIAYFSLRLNGNGTLMTHNSPREEEPGFTNYKRMLSSPYVGSSRLILTIVQKDQDALVSILENTTYRRQAIATIMARVEESRAAGVNIDFEPLGDSATLSDEFTTFIRDLDKALGARDLSISVYPSAAARPRMWDLAKLEEYTDHLVVMTYDYTLPSSVKTGPVAPIRGAGILFEHDILKNLAEITHIFPGRKILLGIPFYGYEWNVEDAEKYTPTNDRGSLASLERIQKMIDEKSLELVWDRNSLTPYAVRREEGVVISQIYFDDINSIKLKLGLVREAGLGGIAIWALGYEGDNPSLWSTIKDEL